MRNRFVLFALLTAVILSASSECRSQTRQDSTCFSKQEAKRISTALENCTESIRKCQSLSDSYQLALQEIKALEDLQARTAALRQQELAGYHDLKNQISNVIDSRRKWRRARYQIARMLD